MCHRSNIWEWQLTHQNLIQEKIKRKLNSGNTCCYSVKNLLFSHLVKKYKRIYKTIIMFLVLHGCETSSLAIREEHILRVFESRVLRRIFGPRSYEVMRCWRNLHNKELCDLYSSSSIVKMMKLMRMRWVGHLAQTEDKRNMYRSLVGKPEGRVPLGRPRCRWVDNTDMDV
jgi:hypothetical protein